MNIKKTKYCNDIAERVIKKLTDYHVSDLIDNL